MAPANYAAWIEEAKAHPFVVKEAPCPSPAPNEVLIRNKAIAINPIDWKMQTYAYFPIPYPNIYGEDVAGEVVEVGSAVTDIKKGQRVIANTFGHVGGANTSAFQNYSAVQAHMVAEIPSSMTFEDASVLPLAISTAAAGLFQAEHFGLPLPTINAKHTGKLLFVWGGASSVGSCAIQLAKATGVEVATTAGVQNHDYCKSIGASHVFDYKSANVVEDIVNALKDKDVIGVFDAITEGDTVTQSINVVQGLLGKGKVVSTIPGTETQSTDNVQVIPVFATTVAENETGRAIYREFLPRALESGTILPKPDALVIGKGLDCIQKGCDMSKAGVSARKIVVSL